MSRHPLTKTLDVMDGRSNPVPEAVIESFRKTGDPVVRDWIIKSHIYLVIGMAGRFASRVRQSDPGYSNFEDRFEEFASVGLAALVQAVDWSGPHLDDEGAFQPSRLDDNNIVPYIKSTVRGKIRTAIEQDRVVFMPGRTFRHKLNNGELDPAGKNTNLDMIGVVSIVKIAVDDYPDEESEEGWVVRASPIEVPIARNSEPKPELEEALDLAILTTQERRMIDLRREGHNYATISSLLGLSTSRVSQIVSHVEERFLKLYA